MVKRRTHLWIAVALVSALALSIPVKAGGAEVASWSPWASLTKIVKNASVMVVGTAKEWTTPDIDGNYVAYCERRVDADGTGPGTAAGDWNVFVYNISTRAKTAVNSGAGQQTAPRVSGGWVVYVDDVGGNLDVKAYKISTGETKVVASGANDQTAPDISGSRVVYYDATSAGVKMFDLNSNVTTTVMAGANLPSISGSRVAFIHANEVKIKDLTSGAVKQVTTDAVEQTLPRIDGDYVVYMQQVAALDYDICAYTISTDSKKVVWTDETSFYCDVSGTKAVWETYNAGGVPFLQAYDFAKDEVVTLATADPRHLTWPTISGNTIACVSSDTSFILGNGDIELGAISAPSVGVSAPSISNYAAKPVLTGRLTENGMDLGGRSLDVLQSTNGGHTWNKVGTTTTRSDGTYSYTAAAQYRKSWFRVRFNGETEGLFLNPVLARFSALSGATMVTPRASLGKPTGYPSTGKRTKTYSVYGSLKPQQTASAATAKVVVIKCYRKVNGKYRLRKTVNAKVYNYDTYSRYRASVKLTSTGKWRLRAYFKGTGINAEKYSAYRYVKVK